MPVRSQSEANTFAEERGNRRGLVGTAGGPGYVKMVHPKTGVSKILQKKKGLELRTGYGSPW